MSTTGKPLTTRHRAAMSAAAHARWDSTPPEQRTEATRPAVVASTERRRLAFEVLRALEAHGLTVAVADADQVKR